MTKSKLLYIAGCPRTGSSLLDVILGNHSRISGCGEVHRVMLNPETRLCSCGQTLRVCPHWVKVISKYAHQWGVSADDVWAKYPVTIVRDGHTVAYSILHLGLVLGHRKLLQLISRTVPLIRDHQAMAFHSWKLYDIVAESDDVSWVVDSSKNAARLKLLYLANPTSFRTIYLLRDGRGVTESLMRHMGISMQQAVQVWRKTNRNIEYVLRSMPRSAQLVVRYEDLCDFPSDTLQKICRFIGVDYEPHMLRLGQRIPHSIPGSPSLFLGMKQITKDERWRTSLTTDDLNIFERLGGVYNQRQGYY